MAEHGFGAANVRRVIVGTSRVVLQQTGFRYQPSTVLNAQMSLCYNLAVALIDRHALIDQFTAARIAEPIVCDLAARVDVEVDPEMDAIYPERYAGIVTIVLDDGRRLRKRVDYSKGMPENRMTAPELNAKFQSLAAAAVDAEDAGGLLEEVSALFAGSSVRRLARHLGGLRMRPYGRT